MFGLSNKAKPQPKPTWYEKDNCTYYGIPNQEKTYIFGFTLAIVEGIRTGGGFVGEGGWLCVLKHANHQNHEFPCFVSGSSFSSVRKFLADITRSEGMPPMIITNYDQKLFSSYIVWKNNEHNENCKRNNKKPDRLAVSQRNMQSDNSTYCYSPTLFYHREDGKIKRIDPATSDFIWVQDKLPSLTPLQIYAGPDEIPVLEVIRAKLEKDGMSDKFICFLLICGHTNVLSLHFKDIMDLFGHVPGMVVTGRWNTGKTLSTNLSVNFLGTNAEKICVIKDTTLTALRDRYTEDHFPIVIHDCKDSEVLSTALQECFEGRPVKKQNQQMLPGTTIAITCNKTQMDFLRARVEALSRAVVIPMPVEMKPATPEEYEEINRGKVCASRHFDKLADLNDDDKKFLTKRTFALRSKISEAMRNVVDSHHRIVDNYCLTIAATELFLDKVGYSDWKRKVKPYAIQKLLPEASKLYVPPASAATSVSDDKSDAVPAIHRFCKTVHLLRQSSPVELLNCLKVLPSLRMVAVRENEFTALVQTFADENKFSFSEFAKKLNLKNLPGPIKYSDDKQKRSLGIPKGLFTEDQLDFLKDGTQDYNAELDDNNEKDSHTMKTSSLASSPFKKVSFNNEVEDEDFNPQSMSTQVEKPGTSNTNMRTVSPIPEVSPERQAGRSGTPDPQNQGRKRPAEFSPAKTSAGQSRNASFVVTESVVATPAASTTPLPSDPKTDSCAACGSKEKNGKKEKYQCKKCRKKFHMECQSQHDKDWPLRTNARNRQCERCRVNA